ncbi:MAG TPA: beta-ketoacyl synthase N-terminal-like domain-containing protein [Longimicrobiaceae bacterium]|nr:beta-ketoacyl synthase N-terminal-like domain-containing protein [Longimicrobiaceae bacterium]
MAEQDNQGSHGDEVAVVGMAGRFSRAADVEAFWRNIRDGVECVSFFSDEQLLEAGVTAEEFGQPGYVRAKGVLEDAELFDAAFFGFSPREAETMDPQLRNWLEVAWTALEHAGYDPSTYDGSIGVFAGASSSTYMLYHLMTNPQGLYALGGMQSNLLTGNGFISTWTSYKLNLRGPSIALSTACSTALVAIHTAAQSLLNGECRMALAGGAGVSYPLIGGYVYDEGGISSRDGHTASFDASATGTVSGSGVGVAVLKRMDDALADGDTIYAVIKGSAINNDGSNKIGYTAPSVDGQAEVIAEAQAISGVEPESIGYVECHGSATPLGDPIEATALAQAFKGTTGAARTVAIGSVKSNLGHLDSAAGIAGFLKTVQALRHRQIPPSLHFKSPNRQIDFSGGPFYVATELQEWKAPAGSPRRAGVSSFGIGGTNAHVILEEAPELAPTQDQAWQLLVLSARTPTALETATRNLTSWLRANPDANLADTAFTLQAGRRMFAHRRAVVARDVADAAAVLAAVNPGRVATGAGEPDDHPVVFLFPGDGAQYVTMGQELYGEYEVFRQAVDDCAAILHPLLGEDLRKTLYPKTEMEAVPANARLQTPSLGYPALFATEYATAKLWMAWGVEPEAMAGHGVGEYVAACLSGVLSLEDALALAVERGRAMDGLPEGAMLIATRSADEVRPLLVGDACVLSEDGMSLCVVSGGGADVLEVERRMVEAGMQVFRQPVAHALGAAGVDVVARAVGERARRMRRAEPRIPYLSNVTGTWMTAADAADPGYWERQVRGPVRFGAAVAELAKDASQILLEVGPGAMLTGVLRSTPDRPQEQAVVTSVMKVFGETERAAVLKAVGALWAAGRRMDWGLVHEGETRRRIPLPTYPFERKFYSLSPNGRAAAEAAAAERAAQAPETVATAGMHPRPNLQNEYVAPRDEAETAITAIWQELFGIEPIGVFDNFFELGGHSLLGTQVVSRVRVALGADIPVRILFEGPTVAELAAAIASGAGSVSSGDTIQRADGGDEAADLLSRLDELSEEEMEALLAQLSAGEEA